MPVHVERRNGRYRLIEPDGGIATTPQGHARDGKNGHATRAEAERQARAINANIRKAGLRTLYASRKLLNADELIAWAKASGFTKTLAPDDMHVTIAFSRAEVDWSAIPPMRSRLRVAHARQRSLESMGDKNASALLFKSEILSERHNDFLLAGASWDWPSYRPHVTISYTGDSAVDLATLAPFPGELLFGPEIYTEVVEDWDEKITERKVNA